MKEENMFMSRLNTIFFAFVFFEKQFIYFGNFPKGVGCFFCHKILVILNKQFCHYKNNNKKI